MNFTCVFSVLLPKTSKHPPSLILYPYSSTISFVLLRYVISVTCVLAYPSHARSWRSNRLSDNSNGLPYHAYYHAYYVYFASRLALKGLIFRGPPSTSVSPFTNTVYSSVLEHARSDDTSKLPTSLLYTRRLRVDSGLCRTDRGRIRDTYNSDSRRRCRRSNVHDY